MTRKIESGDQVHQPQETSIFDSLLHLPKGVDPKEFEVELLNTYLGSKISEYFSMYGQPRPEEFMDVTRTLRTVFLGQFNEERQHWEQTHLQNQPKNGRRTLTRKSKV